MTWTIWLPIIGAFIGGIFVYIRTKYSAKAQDLSKQIEEINKSITELSEQSCAIWCENYKPEDSKKLHYIIGYIEKIKLTIKYLENHYHKFKKLSPTEEVIEFLNSCTGKDFESIKRLAEPTRQREIIINGEKLKIKLLTIRNKIY
jgi:hypothetical protein